MYVLKARWVFTRKEYGELRKSLALRAEWVAEGYAHIEVIHFNDINALVSHKDSIRVFSALQSCHDYNCNQLNIQAAFLKGELEGTISIKPIKRSEIDNNSVNRFQKLCMGIPHAALARPFISGSSAKVLLLQA